MALQKKTLNSDQIVRYVAVGALTIAAFLGAYRFAQAKSATAEQNPAIAVAAATPAAAAGASNSAVDPNASATGASNAAPGSTAPSGGTCCGGAGGSAGGGSCCGGSGSGSSNATVPGKTTVSGGVQKVTVDLTGGSYSPNQITAKAGIPIELVFKGPASGCNGTVVSQQLGFQQDVSNGGTIKIAALTPGTYQWTCGMGMYLARIVVQ